MKKRLNARLIAGALAPVLLALSLFSGCMDEEPEENEIITPEQASSTLPVSPSTGVRNATFGVAYLPEGTINPLTTTSDVNLRMAKLLYDSLFTISPAGLPEYALCTAITLSDDRMSAVLTIRPGVRFSDGSDLTAADVVYSINLARSTSSALYSSRLSVIASASYDNGASTVTLTFTRPTGAIALLLDFPIISKRGDEGGAPAYVGSGRYAIESTEVEGETYRFLQYNPDWYGYAGKKPALPRLDLIETSGLDDLLRAYDNSEVDIVEKSETGDNPAVYAGDAEQRGYINGDLLFIGFSPSANSPFSEAAARVGLNSLVDRTGLCAETLAGAATASVCPVPSDSALYDTRYDSLYGPNAVRAKTLLGEAGFSDSNGDGPLKWKGRSRELTMICNAQASAPLAAARRLAADFRAAGLNVVLSELTKEEYLTALAEGKYDLFVGMARPSPNWDYTALFESLGLSLTSRGTAEPPPDPSGATTAADGTTTTADSTTTAGTAAGTDLAAWLDSFARLDPSSSDYAEKGKALWIGFLERMPIIPLAFGNTAVSVRRGFVANVTPTRNDLFYNIASWEAAPSK